MADFLTRRNGTWHFVRRVPAEFSEFDKRGVVRHSTKVRVSSDRTGRRAVRIIVDPALVSTNGKYFEGLCEIPSSEDSYDEDRAEELWRDSGTLTGIKPLQDPKVGERKTGQ